MSDCRLDLECPGCGEQMRPEQAHNKCDHCGYITPCCEGGPLG